MSFNISCLNEFKISQQLIPCLPKGKAPILSGQVKEFAACLFEKATVLFQQVGERCVSPGYRDSFLQCGTAIPALQSGVKDALSDFHKYQERPDSYGYQYQEGQASLSFQQRYFNKYVYHFDEHVRFCFGIRDLENENFGGEDLSKNPDLLTQIYEKAHRCIDTYVRTGFPQSYRSCLAESPSSIEEVRSAGPCLVERYIENRDRVAQHCVPTQFRASFIDCVQGRQGDFLSSIQHFFGSHLLTEEASQKSGGDMFVCLSKKVYNAYGPLRKDLYADETTGYLTPLLIVSAVAVTVGLLWKCAKQAKKKEE